jgi:ATP-dependent DNA ligase
LLFHFTRLLKHAVDFGALLVGFYEDKRLKFAGRVGTGFSEKRLHDLYAELNKIGSKTVLFLTSRRLAEAVGTKV